MMQKITKMLKKDKEKFVVPKGIQDVIPVKAIYDDGIFLVAKTSMQNPLNFPISTTPSQVVKIKN